MKEFYLQLLEQGWTLNDVDNMDFFYYLDLLIYKAGKDETEGHAYIDQVL
jgi:hypothetical protein